MFVNIRKISRIGTKTISLFEFWAQSIYLSSNNVKPAGE